MRNVNSYNRIVIKIGSAVLANPKGKVNQDVLAAIAEDIAWLRKKNKEVLVVSSGAIALGRKNIHLINNINRKTSKNININLIDDYNINGDFIESQAFAYLAIRSYLKLPISFPKTTNVKEPCTGGIIVENF